VREVVEGFWLHAQANNRFVPRAAAERRKIFDDFVSVFGDWRVADCCGYDLEQWIDGHTDWKSSSTRRSRANWIKAAFNWAARGKLTDENPFAAVTYAEEEPRQPVSDQDFWKIYKLSDRRFRLFLLFLRLVGCRAGEASALDWSMIDFSLGIAVIQKHKSRKKTKKPRTLVLTVPAMKLLKWMRQRATDLTGAVFTNRKGRRWTKSTLDTKWSRLRDRTGVTKEAMIHGIRHAFGTKHCKPRGANIKLVSLAMGHSSVAITEKYYAHLDGEIEAIRDGIEDRSAPKPPRPVRKKINNDLPLFDNLPDQELPLFADLP